MKTVIAPAVTYEFRLVVGWMWEKRTVKCATFAEADRRVNELSARSPHHFRNVHLTVARPSNGDNPQ